MTPSFLTYALERSLRMFAQTLAGVLAARAAGVSATGLLWAGPLCVTAVVLFVAVAASGVGGGSLAARAFWRTAAERGVWSAAACFLAVLATWLTLGEDLGWRRLLTVSAVAGAVILLPALLGSRREFVREAGEYDERFREAERTLDAGPGEEAPSGPGSGMPGTPGSGMPSSGPGDVHGAPDDVHLAALYERARLDAEGEVLRYLPANPRTAKRMVNHVSLALTLARERKVFREGGITPQHLGKWVGIVEQWPQLGSALTTTPSCMARLEAATTVEELRAELATVAPAVVATGELLHRVRDGLCLAPVLRYLVRFEPAPVDTRPAAGRSLPATTHLSCTHRYLGRKRAIVYAELNG